jgi:hypothetical protein
MTFCWGVRLASGGEEEAVILDGMEERGVLDNATSTAIVLMGGRGTMTCKYSGTRTRMLLNICDRWELQVLLLTWC